MYASDFQTAADTAQPLIKEDPKVDVPYFPLAMAALASGDHARARTSYQQATHAGNSGVSLSVSRLADIAMFEGRYDEAITILPAAATGGRSTRSSCASAATRPAIRWSKTHGNASAARTSVVTEPCADARPTHPPDLSTTVSSAPSSGPV